MNRRHFIQSLVAVFSLPANPAFSLQSATAALPTIATVPANARFWAIYISALHGECTPKALQNMLKIPEGDAKHYIGQLIADGIIKPNPLLRTAISEITKSNEKNIIERFKQRLDMKTRTEADDLKGDVQDVAAIDAHQEADLTDEAPDAGLESPQENTDLDAIEQEQDTQNLAS